MDTQEQQPLSEREKEILALLATGATNQEIARALYISPNTVKVHLRNIYAKLGVMNRSEAILVGLQRGIITLPGVETPEDASATLPTPTPMPVGTPHLGRILSAALVLALLWAVALVAWPLWGGATAAQAVKDQAFSDVGRAETGVPPRRSVERWTPQAPMAFPRARVATAVWQSKIFVIGGENRDGILNTTAVYDPTRGLWATAASKPTPVSNAQAARLNDLIFVFGGLDSTYQPTDVIEVYDPVRDQWLDGGRMPHPVAGYALAVLNGKAYLFGGWDGERYLTSAYVYEPTTQRWELLPPLESPRAFAAAVVLDQHIYVIGGYNGQVDLADVWVFDPEAVVKGSNPWSQVQSLLTPRGGATAAAAARSIYVIGGGIALPAEGAERYDPLTDTWARLDTPYGPNWRHMGSAVLGGDVFIIGGWAGAYLPVTERYQASFRHFIPFGPVNTGP